MIGPFAAMLFPSTSQAMSWRPALTLCRANVRIKASFLTLSFFLRWRNRKKSRNAVAPTTGTSMYSLTQQPFLTATTGQAYFAVFAATAAVVVVDVTVLASDATGSV